MNNTITTTTMKKIIFLISFILFVANLGYSQQTNNWYFGSTTQHVGIRIDFNSGSPVVSTCYPILTEEGSSAISDASGNPLFYTDGQKIWDATTNATFGTGLLGGSSSTQSAIVMPKPGATNQWFVFTSGTNGTNGVNYYTVTGSPGSFTISAPTNLIGGGLVGEGLFVIGSTLTGTDFWIISRRADATGTVYSWPVSSTGVVGAQVSSTLSGPSFTNINYCSTIGTIKSNTCQNKLAFSYLNGSVDLVNFNASTGQVVANTAVRINVATGNATCPTGSNSGSYGLEFSPNDANLFITNLAGNTVYKYDIAGNTLTTLATTTAEAGQLQIGPNGVIYMARATSTPSYLSTITNPNSATPTFTELGLLLSGVQCTSNNNYTGAVYRGLPTFPKSLTSTYPVIVPGDTSICRNTTLNYKYMYYAGFVSSIEWDFGDPASGAANTSTSATPSHTFNNLGTFKVLLKITDGCSRVWKDSVYVQVTDPKVPAGRIICGTTGLTFEATGSTAADYPKYVWYDAATGGSVLGVGTPVTVNYGSIAAAPTSVWVEVAGTASVSSSGSNTIGPTIAELNYSGGLSSGTQALSVLASSVTLKSFQVLTRAGASYGGNFTVTITNAASATVFSQVYNVTGTAGGTTYTVNLNKILGSGNYTISISGAAQWMMKSTGTLAYTNAGQLALGGSSPYPILTNLQYDYSNFAVTPTCTQRVKVDRKCLIILPGDGTYCSHNDIPMSYTFEGTAVSQSWAVSPGAAGVDWVFVAPTTSTSAAPNIRFLTAGTYTITLSVTDNTATVFTRTQTFNIIPGNPPAGAISCSATSITLTATGAVTADYPNYVWYNAATGGNELGIGSPVTLNYGDPSNVPSSVWVEIASTVTTTSSGNAQTIGPASGALTWGGRGNGNYGPVSFTTFSDVTTLTSFVVTPQNGTSGNFTVQIRDASNAIVFTKAYTTGAANTPYTVNINTVFSPGTYSITLVSPSITWGGGSWAGASNAQFNFPTSGGAGTFGIANIVYDYRNYSMTPNCGSRVKVDRICSLPVEMISFTGTNKGTFNLLEWVTASEINNDYFEVQYSTDGVNFVTIGRVDGHGNSTMIHQYQFIHSAIQPGVVYYRLIQTDFDGVATTGQVIKIEISALDSDLFVVSPNPSTETFGISFRNLSGGEISVFDVLGKVLLTQYIEAGTEKIEIGAAFAKGAYIVRYTGASGTSSQLIIKE